jgi:hypothetical protein
MPALSQTASAELHGRAIRRIRQICRDDLVIPTGWWLPTTSVSKPEWSDFPPHYDFCLAEGVWICDFHQAVESQPPIKVVVKGFGRGEPLPLGLSQVTPERYMTDLHH